MQQVGVSRERGVATLVHGHWDLVLLSILNQLGPAVEVPLPPGGDTLDVCLQPIVPVPTYGSKEWVRVIREYVPDSNMSSSSVCGCRDSNSCLSPAQPDCLSLSIIKHSTLAWNISRVRKMLVIYVQLRLPERVFKGTGPHQEHSAPV